MLDQSVPPPAALPVSAAPSGSDKIWAILSHASVLIAFPILLPLIVYLAMRGESAYTTDNAREALNFHLSLVFYCLCCVPLVFLVVGIPLLALLGLCTVVLTIVAIIKASEGGCYRYPLTIRLVK